MPGLDKLEIAWAEDRATQGCDLSADPSADRSGAVLTVAPGWPCWPESDKSQGFGGRAPVWKKGHLCLPFSPPLRIIQRPGQRPGLQHRHQHRQPAIRYSPCRPPVTVAGLAQRCIMFLRCGILLHARARPVIQRVPQPHIAAITHTHHLFLAALPRYWRYAPIVP